ncbi:hypothetical protein BD309DRAFT_685100 [Dichomitus squalens]|nr:hypothetical protein BD309DRAFT_685100 [Dichomitus squalens]
MYELRRCDKGNGDLAVWAERNWDHPGQTLGPVTVTRGCPCAPHYTTTALAGVCLSLHPAAASSAAAIMIFIPTHSSLSYHHHPRILSFTIPTYNFQSSMSPKHLPRERAWGTRYDTLDISPPSSPPARRSATAEPAHSPILSNIAHDRPLGSRDADIPITCTTEGRPAQDGTPHDASIFVGRWLLQSLMNRGMYSN